MPQVPLVIVAAVARNGIIGADNRLLWRLKSDMKHFRALTMGKPVLMGRKTFDSIGKPLPGRPIVVVTRDPAWHAEGVTVARSIQEGVDVARRLAADLGQDAVMVAGGGEIYGALIDRAERLEITEVDLAPAGDAAFPAVDPAAWSVQKREEHSAGPDDEAAFAFVTYRRR